MIAALTLEARPQLELRPSPELIAYVALLALPAVELEQAIERELSVNPALEREEQAVCPFCGELLGGEPCLVCRRDRRPAATEPRYEGALCAPPSPRDELLADLRPLAREQDVPVLEYVVGSLDERGYLDQSPDDVAFRLGVPYAQVDRVLGLLHRHGPPGIAASGLRECLLLQLERLAPSREVEIAYELVAEHLEEVAARRWNALAATLGVAREEILAAAALIRTRLRPSAPLDPGGPAPPALPDVVVREREDGSLAVELVEPRRFRVVVAPGYADVDPQRLGAEHRDRLERHLSQARGFLHRLDRRWQTMRAIAELVVERQRAFVLEGPRFILALTRAEVAAELGIHESTVSRATSGRYVLLPSGRLVPFSAFFEPARGPCAALAQLVAAEASPSSDSELATQLGELGFRVARRTVAKYRERMGIPPHTQRGGEGDFAGEASMRSAVRSARA